MGIRTLNNRDLSIAEQILRLQKLSYSKGAELSGFMKAYVFSETIEDIVEGTENYLGYFIEDVLVGIVSYIIEGDKLDIYKLAVHPDFFRRKAAKSLLDFIEQNIEVSRVVVSTEANNIPAVNLYLNQGYSRVKDFQVEEKVFIASFEKQIQRSI